MKKVKYALPYYSSDYIYIYDISISKFMKQKPPCKDCLKEVMCIDTIHPKYPAINKWPTLQIKICEDLRRFVKKNKKFDEKGKRNL